MGERCIRQQSSSSPHMLFDEEWAIDPMDLGINTKARSIAAYTLLHPFPDPGGSHSYLCRSEGRVPMPLSPSKMEWRTDVVPTSPILEPPNHW